MQRYISTRGQTQGFCTIPTALHHWGCQNDQKWLQIAITVVINRGKGPIDNSVYCLFTACTPEHLNMMNTDVTTTSTGKLFQLWATYSSRKTSDWPAKQWRRYWTCCSHCKTRVRHLQKNCCSFFGTWEASSAFVRWQLYSGCLLGQHGVVSMM